MTRRRRTEQRRGPRPAHVAAALAAALALVACGDPRDVDRPFQFHPPHAPTLPEALASIAANRAVDDALTFVATTDPATVSSVAGSLALLPDALLSYLADPGSLGSTAAASALAMAVTPSASGARPRAAAAIGAAPPFDRSCLTATATSLSYAGCQAAMPSPAGESVVTLDGSVQRTDDGLVTWSLVEAVTVTTVAAEAKRVVELTGSVAVSEDTARGWARSVAHSLEKSPGRVVTNGWATFVDVDLATTPPSRCLTGGTLEVRKIWTDRPYGAPRSWPYVDGAFRFTWSACGAFVVARSF